MRFLVKAALAFTLSAALLPQSVRAQAPVVDMDEYWQLQGEGAPLSPRPAAESCGNGCGGSGCQDSSCQDCGCGDSYLTNNCGQCGSSPCSCMPAAKIVAPCDPCQIGKFWFDTDYLNWQSSGMKIPALVTGNPLNTPLAEVGVIGAPSTQVLLGNQQILDSGSSGIRFRGGICICPGWSIQGEYFELDEQSASYQFGADQNLFIGRPFINSSGVPYVYDTQLINLPPDVNGFVRVEASSELNGAAGRVRVNLMGGGCGSGGCGGCGSCGTGCCPTVCSAHLSLGYRHLNLDERLLISEQVVGGMDQFEIDDLFATQSTFNGIEFGLDADIWWTKFCFQTFGRFAVGQNQNSVDISGQTIANIGGTVTTSNSGILTQTSNIGVHDTDVASSMVELGLNVKVPVTRRIWLNVGYSGLYWANVARAGEQIDTRVNPGLFPPPTAGVGTVGAKPTHKLSDYFAHGLNAGAVIIF